MSQEDQSLIDLDAIRARAERAGQEIRGLCDGSRRWTMHFPATVEDSDMVLSNLVVDVEILCSALDAARAELRTNEDSEDARLAIAEAQINKLAEFIMHEVPGEPSRSEGAVDAAIRILSAARAERTEPATGEDVEVVAAFLPTWYGSDLTANEGAERLLAALDLPGRERALREAERERDRLSLTYAALQQEKRLVVEDWAAMRAERDAANAALDEAREERDQARADEAAVRSLHRSTLEAERAHVAEEIAQDLLSLKDWWLGQDEAAAIARKHKTLDSP